MELLCQLSGGCLKDSYDSCNICKNSYCQSHIESHKCGQQEGSVNSKNVPTKKRNFWTT